MSSPVQSVSSPVAQLSPPTTTVNSPRNNAGPNASVPTSRNDNANHHYSAPPPAVDPGHLTRGADGTPVATKSHLDSLGFTLNHAKAKDLPDNIRSDIASITDRNAMFTSMCNTVGGALSDSDKSQILGFILALGTLNGTSDKATYDQELRLSNNRTFAATCIPTCTDYRIRQFFKSYAAVNVEMLKNDPNLAAAAAEKWGYPPQLKNYAFDFNDGLTGLPADVKRQIIALKSRVLPRASERAQQFDDYDGRGPPATRSNEYPHSRLN